MTAAHHDRPIAARVRHVEALLEQRGVVDGAQLDTLLDGFLSTADPANGQRIVARAWTDPDFRQRLLADGNGAVAELGYRAGGLQDQRLEVVANTDWLHNVIVCTLCSCYPIGLLGPSPSWYKSEAYRARVVREPRAVLAEFGVALADDADVRVWDASAETRYMVLPQRPAGTDGLDADQLAGLVTRRGLIGTALV